MTVDLERIARADLKEMGDIRIDDVLSFIDRGIENMPSYMDLYRRWEAQQWAVADLDFTLDREDWLQATDLEKKATLWSHRLFFNGEERVTSTLAPFVWAAPTPEIEVFLSTQMVDEARHTVFFQRWWHDVVRNFELEPHHLQLLELACEVRDRAEQARAQIQAERILSEQAAYAPLYYSYNVLAHVASLVGPRSAASLTGSLRRSSSRSLRF